MLKSRLQELFETKIRDEVKKERGYENPMQVPNLVKITLNVGVGEGKDNPKVLESALKTLATVTGQKPIIQRSKKSISNFKLRAGQPVGASVTLRSHLMWHFYDKLVSVVLPRIRDFQGISVRNLDGRGNLNIGLKDQLVFPEIVFDEVEHLKGMSITIVTSAKDDLEGGFLLSKLGMPFRDFKVAEEIA